MNTQKLPARSGVYVIEISRTPFAYVGSSINVRRRVRHHFARLKDRTHCNKDLQGQYVCYGEERLTARLICYAEEGELSKLERQAIFDLIAEGKTLFNKLTETPRPPRQPCPARGEALRRRWANPQERAKLEAAINARRATSEYKAAMSDVNRQNVLKRWAKR